MLLTVKAMPAIINKLLTHLVAPIRFKFWKFIKLIPSKNAGGYVILQLAEVGNG